MGMVSNDWIQLSIENVCNTYVRKIRNFGDKTPKIMQFVKKVLSLALLWKRSRKTKLDIWPSKQEEDK